MRRHELTDEQYKKLENILPGRNGHVGVTAKDNRVFINGGGFFGYLKLVRHGGIYQKGMVTGKMFIVGFLVGQKQGFLIEFFEFYLKMQIWNFY